MGKVKSNGKFKYAVIGAAVAVVAIGGLMLAMSSSGRGDAEAKAQGEDQPMGAMEIDTSSENAEALFECRVDDIGDTAAMAKLLETMNIEELMGEYAVNIVDDGGVQVVEFTINEPVAAGDKRVFNDNMRKCAQQLMALVPQAGRVDWTYPLKAEKSQDKSESGSLDRKSSFENLDRDIGSYGKSAVQFAKRLEAQSEM